MEKQTKLVAYESFAKRPGSTLPNLAVILDETVIDLKDHRRFSVVLAVWHGASDPFVVWLRSVSNDNPLATGGHYLNDYCYLGWYKPNLEEALAAYKERVEEKLDAAEGRERLANEHA